MTTNKITNIIKNRTAQGFSPRAIAHQIEKEITKERSMIIYCGDCHLPMEIIQQPKWNGGHIELATCKNPRCDLHGVTLTPEQLGSLTTEQLEAYRMMVRNHRNLED